MRHISNLSIILIPLSILAFSVDPAFSVNAWITKTNGKKVLIRNMRYCNGDLCWPIHKTLLPALSVETKKAPESSDHEIKFAKIDWLEVVGSKTVTYDVLFGYETRETKYHIIKLKMKANKKIYNLLLAPPWVHDGPQIYDAYFDDTFFVGKGKLGKVRVNVLDIKKIDFD